MEMMELSFKGLVLVFFAYGAVLLFCSDDTAMDQRDIWAKPVSKFGFKFYSFCFLAFCALPLLFW